MRVSSVNRCLCHDLMSRRLRFEVLSPWLCGYIELVYNQSIMHSIMHSCNFNELIQGFCLDVFVILASLSSACE